MSSADDYEVGYKRPPKHSQFRKGRSGNPNGRPKNPPSKNAAEIANNLLFQLISVKDGSKNREVTMLEAVLTQSLRKAIAGSPQHLKMVLKMIEMAHADKRADADAEAAACAASVRRKIEDMAARLQEQSLRPDSKPIN